MRAWILAALSLASACGADGDELGAVASVDPRSRCYPVIEFGDPRLEAQIRERIDLPAGPLSVLEVEALWWWESSIDDPALWDIDGADLYGIRDLEGIQCLPFTRISCADCPVRDLGPLAGMPELEVLRISGARALSLDPLAELVELREVSLAGGSVIDADALLGGDAVFPWLELLNLSGNLITESVGTPKLPALERLYLGDNALRAAPDVSRMPSLTHLYLDDNPLRELGPLAGHAKLRELSAKDAGLTSIEPLASLPLEVLRLAGNRLTDAGAVPVSVRELDLRRNELRALTWPTLPALRRLDLDDNPLVSLEGLRAPALEELRASGCALTSTAGIEVVAAPTVIDLRGNKISRPAGIRGDDAHLDVDLRDNAVDDLSGLAGVKRMRDLRLSGNPLRDLSTLPPMALRGLFVDGAELEDIAGIEGVTLFELVLADNPLSDLSPLAGADLEAGPRIVDISDTAVADLTPLAEHGSYPIEIVAARTKITELSQLLAFAAGGALDVDLSGNGIVDASVLADPSLRAERIALRDNAIVALPKMEGVALDVDMLDLAGNQISSLAPLAGARLRGTVDLSRNALTTLDGLDEVIFFQVDLLLADNDLVDVSALAAAEGRIRRLNLAGNQLTYVPSLSGRELDRLDLSDNPTPVVNVQPGLRYLTCDRCGLPGLGPLSATFDELLSLEVSENPLTSLAALAGAQLGILRVNDVGAGAFAALPAGLFEGVYELEARGNGVTDLGPFGDIGLCDLRDNAIRDLGPLRGDSSDTYVLEGNPIDLELSLPNLYRLCVTDSLTVSWDEGRCAPPDYGGS